MNLNFFKLLLILCFPIALSAQTTAGLRAYYSFDNCDATDESSNQSDGTLFGNISCSCGVSGQALSFDGVDDYVIFFGLVNTNFDDKDFSVSFYYKPVGGGFLRSLISKRELCDEFDYLDIRAQPAQNRVNVEVYEDNINKVRLVSRTNTNTCWQHIVVTRADENIKTYVNGVLTEETTTSTILNIQNNAVLSLSDSPCIGEDGTGRFKGLVDELRIYNRPLSQGEINELYLKVDQIGNRSDTVVFLGTSLQPYVANTCANDFFWSPADGVSDTDIPNPVITPAETTTYTLTMTDSTGCTAEDTIRVKVVDPSLLGCDQVFLPKAFTPNGDGINDIYRISNPQAIEEFISLEIFNRWGARVFITDFSQEGWDGTFNNNKMPPGVFIYQLSYICDGEKIARSGSITLLK